MEKEELLRKIINRDGIKDILIHNSEEAGEYLTAINHCRRGKCDSLKLAKEIADVRIMMEYVQCIFNINPELVEKYILDDFAEQQQEVSGNSSHK